MQEFLASHGVVGCKHSANSDFIHCDVTVAKAEEMLATTCVNALSFCVIDALLSPLSSLIVLLSLGFIIRKYT